MVVELKRLFVSTLPSFADIAQKGIFSKHIMSICCKTWHFSLKEREDNFLRQ